jgi:hypothetical protein
VLAYAEALLASSEHGTANYIHADMREVGTVLDQAAQLLDAVPPGSYLAISHGGSDLLSQQELEGIMDVADRQVQQEIAFRTREQVARFFESTDLVEHGLVRVEEWRPNPARTGRTSPPCGVLWAASADAPRGAPLYPRYSREEFGGRFPGLMPYLNPKSAGANSMAGN